MSFVPGDLDTSRQPEMTVPLRHFVIGLGFLLAGIVVGTGLVVDRAPGLGTLAHVHLLLAGWVCVTIMGAMTQFVPVWSGTSLHSQRLASLQLALVTTGLIGFVGGLLAGDVRVLVPFGGVMLAGFWTFVYNLGRTFATVTEYDVTERHFLLTLGFFLVLTPFGVFLAVDLNWLVLTGFPITHGGLLGAHATLAVFGAIVTTIYGALYQLGTMFTQTELHGIDHRLRAMEELAHPGGVVLLAMGRLFDAITIARIGGLLVVVAALSFGIILAQKLVEMQVEWTPMHRRYVVVTVSLLTWAVLTVPSWVRAPTDRAHLFGAPGSVHVLVLGVIGFVILGTLYHIVPFIIWVHRYSDLLGFEEVPMIDDLYDERLAAIDLVLVASGTALLVFSSLGAPNALFPVAGGVAIGAGALIFSTNMVLVIHRHNPHPFDRVLLGSYSPRESSGNEWTDPPVEKQP